MILSVFKYKKSAPGGFLQNMFWTNFYSLLTAPGVVVHELAHAFFCLFFGVRIHKISLFRFDKVAGYVIHDEAQGFFANFFICFGPLVINSALAMRLFLEVAPELDWKIILYLWLGIALALHAIPSTGDARSLLQSANRNFFRNPLVIIFYPLVLVLYILNWLKRFYLSGAFAALLFYLAKTYL